jgi:hypothetical protein
MFTQPLPINGHLFIRLFHRNIYPRYNIKINPRNMGWGGMDWNNLSHDKNQWKALVNTVMKPYLDILQ